MSGQGDETQTAAVPAMRRFSRAEIRALESFAGSAATPPRQARRARMVLEAASGAPLQEVAIRLGASPTTVTQWLTRYLEHGLDGLSDLPRSGRPRFAQRRPQAADQSPSASRKASWNGETTADHDDATLEQLLAAASRTISRRGVAATRVSDIAREAGVSSAAVHYYFKTKEEILVKALLWANRTSAARLEPPDPEANDPVARLHSLIERSIPYEGTQRDEYLLEIDLWSSVRLHPELLPAWESYHRWWIAQVTKIILDGMVAGRFHADISAEEAAERLVALTDGLSAQAAIGSSGMPAERVRDLVLRFASDLLGADLPARR